MFVKMISIVGEKKNKAYNFVSIQKTKLKFNRNGGLKTS